MRRAIPVLIPVAALLAGCSTSSPSVNTTPVSAAPTTAGVPVNVATTSGLSTSAAASTSASKAKLGDTVDLTGEDGAHIQVTLVKLVDPVKATNEFETPSAGKRYVAVQMRIVNLGKKVYDTDPMAELKARDADGEIFDADFSPVETAVGQRMDSGLTLAPGDKTLGVMTLEVPNGVKLTSMQYTIGGLAGRNAAKWVLG